MDVFLFTATAVGYRIRMEPSAVRFFSSVATNVLRRTTEKPSGSCGKIEMKLLKKQNAETSSAIIEIYAKSADFQKLASYEGKLTTDRDEQDGIKLQKGIDFAKEKGVIDPNYVPDKYKSIDVLGKTPDQVSKLISDAVCPPTPESSFVLVLVGLSGTGKGTTVAKLREHYQGKGKTVMTWSNGNLFRSVTLLAATWCQQQKPPVEDVEKACTKENLANFMSMLSFEERDGKFDTHIQGLGLDYFVGDVQNTALKSPIVSKNIPTVAQYTQGEVILFAAAAMETLLSGQPNTVVLLEGREQTVNYVPSPHRFCLILSDPTLIGKRRAAQRLMAGALKMVEEGKDTSTATAIDSCLQSMVKEIGK